MMKTLDFLLGSSIKSLKHVEISKFKQIKLDALFSLRHVVVEKDLIRAAAQYWDPTLHLFRFKDAEICPTIEEFEALLGHDGKGPTIFPKLEHGYVDSFSKLFSIDVEVCTEFYEGNQVNLLRLMRRFLPPSNGKDIGIKTSREVALCFVLVARFLLIRKPGYGNHRICPLIRPLLEGGNIMPLVLAETINSLDDLFHEASLEPMGSPLLLQMWLLDRLKLAKIPETPNYHPPSFLRRGRLYESGKTMERWVEDLGSVESDNIAWVVPWWKTKDSKKASWGHSCLCLTGMYETSFIFPIRVLRQFGIEQDIPRVELPTFPRAMLTPGILSKLTKEWNFISQGFPYEKTWTTLPTKAYREWYEIEIEPMEDERDSRRKDLIKDGLYGPPPGFEEWFKTQEDRPPSLKKRKRTNPRTLE